MDDKRYNAMNQSILLASIFLEIGMPYLSSFIPDPIYTMGYNPREDPERPYERVNIRKAPTDDDIQVVRNELNEISKGLEWWEDTAIFRSRGWWGITASCYPRATEGFGERRIVSSKRMDERVRRAGFDRRQNSIGLTSQYVDTLLNSDKATEQHLCAAFHLAVTLVHEIGHVVYWQNLRNEMDFMGLEPVVGNHVLRELGLAFTSWIFGGWNPQPILDYGKDTVFFNRGMYWDKQLLYQRRPRWTMRYSMSFAYVQRLMTQSTWDEWSGNLLDPRVKAMLMAPAPFRYGQDARVAICEKQETGGGRWAWKKMASFTKIFQEEADDEEDLPRPPGIPPFGFHDEDWTAGPEVEVYRPTDQRQGGSDPVRRGYIWRNPSSPANVEIVVTYSGIYDQVAGYIYPPSNPPGELSTTGTNYATWPEGVLRSLCSEYDISTFGNKSELVARLERFDVANAGRQMGAGGNEREALEESAQPRRDPSRLTYNLDFETTVDAWKQMVYADTGIPPHQQLLVLDKIVFEQKEPLDVPTKLATWRQRGDWDDILLYRIRRAPRRGDPTQPAPQNPRPRDQ